MPVVPLFVAFFAHQRRARSHQRRLLLLLIDRCVVFVVMADVRRAPICYAACAYLANPFLSFFFKSASEVLQYLRSLFLFFPSPLSFSPDPSINLLFVSIALQLTFVFLFSVDCVRFAVHVILPALECSAFMLKLCVSFSRALSFSSDGDS